MKQHLLGLLHHLTPGLVGGGLFVLLFLIWLVTALARRHTNVTVLMPGGGPARAASRLGWKAPLAAVAAAVLGFGAWYERHPFLKSATTPPPAALPSPSASPSPVPTMTRTIIATRTVHDAAAMNGAEMTLLGLGALIALVLAVKFYGRYFGS